MFTSSYLMMLPAVTSLLMMSQLTTCQSVFSSTEEMGKIVKLEKEVVVEMKKHSVKLEMALTSIDEYVGQVSKVDKLGFNLFYSLFYI